MIQLKQKPIIDNESQPSIGQALGINDFKGLIQPDLPSILAELVNTDKEKIALTTNIDSGSKRATIVSMTSYANITEDLFRNLNPNHPEAKEILSLVKKDKELIEQQIAAYLKASKALKGYTTNKIVEAIVAKLARQDRGLRSLLAPKSKGGVTEAI